MLGWKSSRKSLHRSYGGFRVSDPSFADIRSKILQNVTVERNKLDKHFGVRLV